MPCLGTKEGGVLQPTSGTSVIYRLGVSVHLPSWSYAIKIYVAEFISYSEEEQL